MSNPDRAGLEEALDALYKRWLRCWMKDEQDPLWLRDALKAAAQAGDELGYARGRAEGNCDECEGWRSVAVDAFKAIDAYARSIFPELPEHYGMPVDGVRKAFESAIRAAANRTTEDGSR
jgi:hypothetical protein